MLIDKEKVEGDFNGNSQKALNRQSCAYLAAGPAVVVLSMFVLSFMVVLARGVVEVRRFCSAVARNCVASMMGLAVVVLLCLCSVPSSFFLEVSLRFVDFVLRSRAVPFPV